jgi:hypothetical protein
VARKVVLFAEEDRQSTASRIAGNAATIDAAPNDGEVVDRP